MEKWCRFSTINVVVTALKMTLPVFSLSLFLYTLSNPMRVCSDLHVAKKLVVILEMH